MGRRWAAYGTSQPIRPVRDMGSRSTAGLKFHLEKHVDLYEKWKEARQTKKKNGGKTKSLGDKDFKINNLRKEVEAKKK